MKLSQSHKRTDLERLLRKYIKSDHGCWEWTASYRKDGRPQFYFLGSMRLAARCSFFLHNGKWPIQACHKCDNPKCINPNHLFDGTQSDNMADMMQKGRGVGQFSKGEGNSKAKLSKEDVIEILGSLESNTALAKRFGVTQPAICHIKRGRNWRNVDESSASQLS